MYQYPRSGLGTCTGSFIREEEMPNSFTNDYRTKVGSTSTRQAEFVEAPVCVEILEYDNKSPQLRM